MSGSVYASQAAQQQIANFAAWMPPQGLVGASAAAGSQWPPNAFQFGTPNPLGYSVSPNWFETVYNQWILPDPLPTIPAPDALNIGAGATFTIFHATPVIIQSTVLPLWIPPDPQPTIPIQIGKHVTASGPPIPPAPVPGNAVNPPHNVAANGAIPVYVTTNSKYNGAVPAAGTANTIVNGGVAIIAAVGPLNGGYITNPLNAAAQGVTAEDINIDMTGPPLAGDAFGFGTTVTIPAGSTFTIPAIAAGVNVWVNAVTAGHRITVVVW